MSFTFPFFDFVSVHSSTTGVRSRLQIAPTSSAPVNSPPSDTRETSYQCYARRSSPTTELAQFHQFASVKRLTMQCSSHSPCSIVQPDSIRYLDENYPTFTSRSFSNFTAPNRGAHSPEHTSQSLSRQVSFWYFLDIFLVILEETVKQTASSDLFFLQTWPLCRHVERFRDKETHHFSSNVSFFYITMTVGTHRLLKNYARLYWSHLASEIRKPWDQ